MRTVAGARAFAASKLAACGPLLLAAGCIGGPSVERAYEDRSVTGRYIDEGAYASFLQGALAEAGGDLRGALSAYELARKQDAASAEIRARIGAVRCRIDPRDRAADKALSEALALDPRLGRAWSARAQCALARGDEALARSDAEQAARCDAGGDDDVLASRADGGGAARTRWVALTLTARDKAIAWDALAAWARSRGDRALRAEALERLARVDPSRRGPIAEAAEQMAAGGDLAAGRRVAAAAVDASHDPLDEARYPLAARLAVDEALVRGDADRARERASTARVALEEVAGRALLLGHPEIAKRVARDVAAAEPGNVGAHLVLAAAGGDVVGAAASSGEAGSDAPASGSIASAASAVAFGEALVHAVSPADARRTLARIARAPAVAGDDRVAKGEAALVAGGVLGAVVKQKAKDQTPLRKYR